LLLAFLHKIIICGNLDVLQKIWEWAKERLTTEEISKKLLLAKNKGRTALHVAADSYKLEIFQEILKWVKEKLTTQQVNKLLVATDHERMTALHIIVRWGQL